MGIVYFENGKIDWDNCTVDKTTPCSNCGRHGYYDDSKHISNEEDTYEKEYCPKCDTLLSEYEVVNTDL